MTCEACAFNLRGPLDNLSTDNALRTTTDFQIWKFLRNPARDDEQRSSNRQIKPLQQLIFR